MSSNTILENLNDRVYSFGGIAVGVLVQVACFLLAISFIAPINRNEEN